MRFSLYSEPSYEDSSTVIVVAENSWQEKRIPFPFVVLMEHWKVWRMPFEKAVPECVYRDLASIYERMKKVVEMVLECFVDQ